ncbi:MAG: hypothetical protein ACKOEO_23775 [Planctomycetaceae bacterium]
MTESNIVVDTDAVSFLFRADSREKFYLPYVRRHFVIFHQTADLCSVWATLRVDAERKGRHLSNSDAWIAATAVLLDVPLLTHNRKDYASLESLQIISESSEGEKG